MIPIACTIPGCDAAPHARGLCQKHYIKAWRLGIFSKQQPSRDRIARVRAEYLARGQNTRRYPWPKDDAGVCCAMPGCDRLVWRDGTCRGHAKGYDDG